MEDYRIIMTKEGAVFKQGDLSFSVKKTLDETIGAGHAENVMEGSVLDRLTDSSIAALAAANGLPINPFSREDLKPVLHGIIQHAWLRDVDGRVSDRNLEYQRKRVERYLARLEEIKLNPEEESGKSTTYKAVRQYRVSKNADISSYRGRRLALLTTLKQMGPATIFQITEKLKTNPDFKTKSDLTRVVTYLVNDHARSGEVEILGEQFKFETTKSNTKGNKDHE